MKKRRVQSKIGKLLFHRMGIVAVLIVAQIVLYAAGLVVLRDSVYFDRVEWLFLVLSVLAAMWIVGSRSNPGYKIGWLIIVLGLMPFGSLAYLLLGGNHLSAFNQRRLRSMERKIRKNLKNECGRSASLGELMGEDAACMAHYLEQTTHCPVYGNTRTKYYPLGDNCYDDILCALRGAERYIFIEYFIIEEGKLWNSVLDILREKAEQGLEVRVIYDDIGSMATLPGDYPARLEQVGVHCRVFNRFVPVVSLRQNNRDHRKYMIVDGRMAFTGGINMADEYINVKRRFFRPEPARGGAQGYVQPYHDCPWDNEAVGQSVYLNLIYRAKRYVYITTPYLVIDYSLTMALTSAAKSGVDVRIITPHIPDKKTVFEMTRSYYEELLEAGVQIFEYEPGFIHSKNFVVDDLWATVGTVNLDYRSMFLHFENGVLLYGTPSVHDIRDDFLETQTRSLMVTLEECRSISMPHRTLRDLLRLFAPLL
ncbi:MAG: cardiolipin synthase [Oscillospiraceae bacterium]|nr:cardiolipin synthase [Oscillospiraceae bacterium]